MFESLITTLFAFLLFGKIYNSHIRLNFLLYKESAKNVSISSSTQLQFTEYSKIKIMEFIKLQSISYTGTAKNLNTIFTL